MTETNNPKIQCLCGCGRQFKQRTGWHVFFTTKCKHIYNREMVRRGKEHLNPSEHGIAADADDATDPARKFNKPGEHK